MLILRNIIITLLLMTLAAVAVVGLMVEFPPILHWTPDRINEIGRSVVRVMRPGLLLFIIWWVVLLSTLLVFFMSVARPRRRMKIEVQMGGGKVVIMDAAIKRYVRNALSELNDVTVKKIDLREQRGQVTTDIYADVRTKENLPTLERRIISRVRGALAEDLGITNLGDVHVFIKNFEVTGRPIKPDPEPADQPESKLDAVAAELTPSSVAAASTAGSADENLAMGGVSSARTYEEPVIGGDTVRDAENSIGEAPVLPPDNSGIAAADLGAEPTVTTESTNLGEVILAEKSLPAEDDANEASGVGQYGRLGNHDDLDEPLPWETARTENDPIKLDDDDDKNGGGLRSS